MTATSAQRSDEQVTRMLVERIVASEAGGRLRAQVHAWCPATTSHQVDDAVQEACLLAGRSCRGQSEAEVYIWLRTTARRELALIHQRARREVPSEPAQLERYASEARDRDPEQHLIDREEDAEVARVGDAVLARLSERQREIAALHVRGRKRPQIAAHLGMSPRSVKRHLERIMTVGRDELLRQAGDGCPDGEPVVARLAFGLASPREMRDAQLHLATCPRCGMLYERLDVWREKVATLLPLPVVEHVRPGLGEWALQRAAEAAASLKQHATAGYARVADPTPWAACAPAPPRPRSRAAWRSAAARRNV